MGDGAEVVVGAGPAGLLDADELWPVYDAVFGDAEQSVWRQSTWDPHTARAGFRVATARDAASPGERGRLLGFAYGYTGERGQWWTDTVSTTLPIDVADRWLGGHFELVSIGVLDVARGSGLGRRLLRAVLDGLWHDRLLLMTDADADNPARRLYAAEGWTVLGPGTGPTTVVMGRRTTGAS